MDSIRSNILFILNVTRDKSQSQHGFPTQSRMKVEPSFVIIYSNMYQSELIFIFRRSERSFTNSILKLEPMLEVCFSTHAYPPS